MCCTDWEFVIANDCDISPHTAKGRISVLETSNVVKHLSPYYKNNNKRVIKSPKLYFYDSSLVCSLLEIRAQEELHIYPIRGALFESFMVSELFKYSYNHNEKPQIYFWRDLRGHEIDVIIEKSFDKTIPSYRNLYSLTGEPHNFELVRQSISKNYVFVDRYYGVLVS